MKNGIKYIFQKLLGLPTYLYLFANYKIRTLESDKKENDFFLFLRMLKNGNGTILDVGANLGIMTVHLARNFPQSSIHSFEPMPQNAEVLHRVIRKNKLKNVEVHEVALGDQEGRVKMILPVNKSTVMQGLSHVKHDSITEWNEGSECEVPLTTIDSFDFPAVQGIKIDVENFEYFALKGGMHLLERDKPLIYAELWDNQNRVNCFDLLGGIGYRVMVSNAGTLKPFDRAKDTTQNFFFLPE